MPKPKKRKPNKVHANRTWCLETSGNEQMLFADGFDDCIIGVTGGIEPVAVYDKDLMIQELVSQGMDEIEAIEYLEFNTWGAYVGEQTPIYIHVRS
jgi:hypothetical protein